MDRRTFTKQVMTSALLAEIAAARAAAQTDAPTTHDQAMATVAKRHAALLGGPQLTIALMPYPGMFLQDFVGPLTMFESLMNRDILIVWKDLEPIDAGSGFTLTPTTTFDACPDALDVLFVPGGVPGTFAMMEDEAVLRFLAARGKTARFVTSVCTGSLILAAAGLLDGYKATSYWNTRDVLATLGAIPTARRVVIDRNRMTGGGVTAGLDFGLHLIAALRSRAYAEAVQLYVEYDPAPPFRAGSPGGAASDAKAFIDQMFAPVVAEAKATAMRARTRQAR